VLPPGATLAPEPGVSLFSLREDLDPGIVDTYLAFTRAHGIEIAGIELIESVDGRVLTYDVNTNTNYNPQVEAAAPRSGPREVARYLGRLLEEERARG
jgi:hypothetical protein